MSSFIRRMQRAYKRGKSPRDFHSAGCKLAPKEEQNPEAQVAGVNP